MEIKTKRLLLRPAKMEDARDLVEIMNDLLVTRYMGRLPYPYTIKDARSFLRMCIKRDSKPVLTDHDFRIVLRKTNKVIGGIGLIKVDQFAGKAEVGYVLGRNYWRLGYGSEALDAIIKYSFKKMKLQRLEAPIYPENRASQGLVRKFGFKKEGIRRRAGRSGATGKLHDVAIYALLKPGKVS